MSLKAPLNGHDRRIAPTADASAPLDGDQFDASVAMLRLLVGGILVGADELRSRLEQWQDAAESIPRSATPHTAADMFDTPRYTLVGMLFEAQARARQGLNTMRARVSRLADESDYRYARLAYAMRGTPLDPIRMRVDEFLFLAMGTIDRWTDRGWLEEQRGRSMARQATATVIDELLDYMAHNPEVRKLVEQQGLDMATSAVEEVRERTAAADQWIERFARHLLHRPMNHATTTFPRGADEGLPVVQAPTTTTAGGAHP